MMKNYAGHNYLCGGMVVGHDRRVQRTGELKVYFESNECAHHLHQELPCSLDTGHDHAEHPNPEIAY